MTADNRCQRQRSGRAEPAGEGVPSQPELRSQREFIRRLLGYVKSRRLYPPGHARIGAQLDAWHRTTVELLAGVPEITLCVEPDALIVMGRKLDDREPLAAELAAELIRRLVRHIAIAPGVGAGDLSAVAEILLLDPDVLKARGGAAAVIAEAKASAIAVMGFSYDMQEYVQDSTDVELARSLSRCNAAGTPEEVVGEFAEKRVSSDERGLLKELMADDSIRERLGALGMLVARNAGTAAEGKRAAKQVRASDVLVLLVRELAPGGAGGAENVLALKDEIAALLDRMKTDLTNAAMNAAVASREQALSALAASLFGSREAVRHWVGQSQSAQRQAGGSGADALRAIFSRVGGTSRSFRLGASVLAALKASGAASPAAPAAAPGTAPVTPPGKAPAAAAPGKRGDDPPEATLANVARGLAALTEKCGGARLEWDAAKIDRSHRDTLLALVECEEDAAAREGIGQRLAAFLDRKLEEDAQAGSVLMAGVTEACGAKLRDSDRAILVGAPAVCAWALGRLIDANESAWYAALRFVAKSAVFAQAFGTLLLTRSASMPQERLREFCPLCYEDLCKFLAAKVHDETRSSRLERVVECVLANVSPAAVGVIEQLLPRVGAGARQQLFSRLVEIDNREAFGVISRELVSANLHVRMTIIKTLGYSGSALAEAVLADRLGGGGADKADVEERLACLESLRRLGTERCLDAIQAIAGDWRLLFSSKGRRLRAQAKAAAKAVRARLMQRLRLSEEELHAG